MEPFPCESYEIFHKGFFTIHLRVSASDKSNHTDITNMFLERKTLKKISISITYFCQWYLKVKKFLHLHREISNDWLLSRIIGYNIYSV